MLRYSYESGQMDHKSFLIANEYPIDLLKNCLSDLKPILVHFARTILMF